MIDNDGTRKIEMDSIDDVYHLMNGFREASKDLLEDEFRSKSANKNLEKQVMSMMDKWIKELFISSSPNVTVGGRDCKELLENNTEPFDESLLRKSEQLEREAKDHIKTVLQKRKTAPQQMVPLMKEELERQSAFADRVVFESKDEYKETIDSGLPSNAQDMSKDYLDAMQLLAKLEKTVQSRLSKYEQIKRVVGEAGSSEISTTHSEPMDIDEQALSDPHTP